MLRWILEYCRCSFARFAVEREREREREREEIDKNKF